MPPRERATVDVSGGDRPNALLTGDRPLWSLLFTAAPGSRLSRWLIAGGIGAAAVATVLMLVLHLQRGSGGVNPVTDMLSDYALVPDAWVFHLSLIVVSGGSAALWLALARHHVLRGWLVSAGMAAWCAGLVCVALFTKDHVQGNATVTGGMHLYVTAIACGSLPLVCMIIGWRHRRHRNWGRYARAVFVLAVANVPCVLPFLIAFLLNRITGTESFSGPATGLIERIMGVLDICVLVVFGLWARRAARAHIAAA